MRIVDERQHDGIVRVILDPGEGRPLLDSAPEVMRWAAETLPNGQGSPWSFSAGPDETVATFFDNASAMAFLGRFVPGALAEVARGLEGVVGDYADVIERDGRVEVTIRYVGDAGSGTDEEPHERTWSDYVAFAEAARELGLRAEHVHSDHDTIEVALVPATTRESAS